MYTVLGGTAKPRLPGDLGTRGNGPALRAQASASLVARRDRGEPLGKGSGLLDGDEAVADSVAILNYLADKHGLMTAPAGSLARAKQDLAGLRASRRIRGPSLASRQTQVRPAGRIACARDRGIRRLGNRTGAEGLPHPHRSGPLCDGQRLHDRGYPRRSPWGTGRKCWGSHPKTLTGCLSGPAGARPGFQRTVPLASDPACPLCGRPIPPDVRKAAII